jgi:hypothetical protein
VVEGVVRRLAEHCWTVVFTELPGVPWLQASITNRGPVAGLSKTQRARFLESLKQDTAFHVIQEGTNTRVALSSEVGPHLEAVLGGASARAAGGAPTSSTGEAAAAAAMQGVLRAVRASQLQQGLHLVPRTLLSSFMQLASLLLPARSLPSSLACLLRPSHQ